jgi:selenocysteine lyase/cysteine desulfurase
MFCSCTKGPNMRPAAVPKQQQQQEIQSPASAVALLAGDNNKNDAALKTSGASTNNTLPAGTANVNGIHVTSSSSATTQLAEKESEASNYGDYCDPTIQADKQQTNTFTAQDEILQPLPSAISSASDLNKLQAMNVVDLADEKVETDGKESYSRQYRMSQQRMVGSTKIFHEQGNVDPLEVIRLNLPNDPMIYTPFGERRLTYADYTASGRALRFIEEYINRVVNPMFANTHTEASATGLQTSHFREEARKIIMDAIHADPKQYELIFAGTGTTGAINKMIAILGIKVPAQMQKYMKDIPQDERPMVFISAQEHHSNELMWRETVADVEQIPMNSKGELALDILEEKLNKAKHIEKRKLIIGSFSAGSNVTGLLNNPGPIASVCHKYGCYACFDYAAAAPYVNIKMASTNEDDELSYLDAIYISPHKFVGGPGTPGILCIKKEFANCTGASQLPPSIPGGGTVTMVSVHMLKYDISIANAN